MKEFKYIKSRPLAFASVIILLILYLAMIFAEFIAPYPASQTFEANSFHPANVSLTLSGLKAKEARVLSRVTWRYAFVKGMNHNVKFFVHGSKYKFLGFIDSDIHLFGTEADDSGNAYPAYLFGADNLGRDMFSRMVYGSRISLTIGFVATAVSLLLAVILGGLSGYYGGKTDWTIMRISEFFMLIPGLYLILFLRSLLNTKMDSGTSYMIITIILSLVGWPGSARTIRGMIHSIKREEFVMNAALEGIPSLVIIFRHIIPQIASLLIVSTALSIPGFIMSETALSYLGLGIADPAVSWGSMINREVATLSNLSRYPWLLSPVWLLLAVTLAFNFIGDALRDFYDPYHAVFPSWKRKRKSQAVSGNENPDVPEFDLTLNPENILEIKNLSVEFAGFSQKDPPVKAVRNISYNVRRGEILGVVGESGSGKSVSTTAIPGLLPENASASGHIYFEGVDLMGLSKNQLREYRGKKIGLILQEPGRSFDPLQNMGSVFLEIYRNMDSSITKEESDKKAAGLLGEVGLPDPDKRLVNYPHQFSGGQLQRIGIALALAQGCSLLIADEPTTALDVTIQMQIVSLLLHLKESRGLSIIFISHNIDLVSQISDRIIVMYGGKILEKGSASQIQNQPRHPYTQALIGAMPKFGTSYKDTKLVSIPGKIMDPKNPEPGCPFAPRCSHEKAECRKSGTLCWKMEEK